MNVLVTGFDPFNNDTITPAWEAVNLPKDEVAGAQIVKVKVQVPTVFRKSIQVIREALLGELLKVSTSLPSFLISTHASKVSGHNIRTVF